jgi:hypothetical protein
MLLCRTWPLRTTDKKPWAVPTPPHCLAGFLSVLAEALLLTENASVLTQAAAFIPQKCGENTRLRESDHAEFLILIVYF